MFLHRNENIKWGKGMFNATSSSISRNKYRSILISNTQLGIRRCKASSPLLEFLIESTCDHLYLASDIIDGRQITNRTY